jgi:hypothetical protein
MSHSGQGEGALNKLPYGAAFVFKEPKYLDQGWVLYQARASTRQSSTAP